MSGRRAQPGAAVRRGSNSSSSATAALIIVLFALVSVVLACSPCAACTSTLRSRSSLPTQHEYMQTYLAPKCAEFRGAQPRAHRRSSRATATCSQPEFFDALKRATDEVIVMDGIDRGRVQSLFTPNVRYLEVVEDGIEAGNVVPADFQPTPESMAAVRENILKAGIVGRLVANDFSGALVSAIVLEEDANGVPVDPIDVARELEEQGPQAHRGHRRGRAGARGWRRRSRRQRRRSTCT